MSTKQNPDGSVSRHITVSAPDRKVARAEAVRLLDERGLTYTLGTVHSTNIFNARIPSLKLFRVDYDESDSRGTYRQTVKVEVEVVIDGEVDGMGNLTTEQIEYAAERHVRLAAASAFSGAVIKVEADHHFGRDFFPVGRTPIFKSDLPIMLPKRVIEQAWAERNADLLPEHRGPESKAVRA